MVFFARKTICMQWLWLQKWRALQLQYNCTVLCPATQALATGLINEVPETDFMLPEIL